MFIVYIKTSVLARSRAICALNIIVNRRDAPIAIFNIRVISVTSKQSKAKQSKAKEI